MPATRRNVTVDIDPDGNEVSIAEGSTIEVSGTISITDPSGDVSTYSSGLSVGGAVLDKHTELLEELVRLQRQILWHLREMTGEDYGD